MTFYLWPIFDTISDFLDAKVDDTKDADVVAELNLERFLRFGCRNSLNLKFYRLYFSFNRFIIFKHI